MHKQNLYYGFVYAFFASTFIAVVGYLDGKNDGIVMAWIAYLTVFGIIMTLYSYVWDSVFRKKGHSFSLLLTSIRNPISAVFMAVLLVGFLFLAGENSLTVASLFQSWMSVVLTVIAVVLFMALLAICNHFLRKYFETAFRRKLDRARREISEQK